MLRINGVAVTPTFTGLSGAPSVIGLKFRLAWPPRGPLSRSTLPIRAQHGKATLPTIMLTKLTPDEHMHAGLPREEAVGIPQQWQAPADRCQASPTASEARVCCLGTEPDVQPPHVTSQAPLRRSVISP